MTLENFCVEELSIQECMDIDGGNPFLIGLVAFGVGSAVFLGGVAVGYYLR